MDKKCYICSKNNSYDYGYNIILTEGLDSPGKNVHVCTTCLTTQMKFCSMCGTNQYYSTNLSVINKWSGQYCCKKHADVNPSYKKIIDGGKAETYIGFIGKPLDNLYLGVELEAEVEGNTEKKTLETIISDIFDLFDNFIIIKTDGSLTGNGIEIVSAPAPFDVHTTAWNKFLDECHTKLRSNVFSNGTATNCGMHVHFSRKALTVIEIGKVAYFINTADNNKLIEDIAGRYNTNYCAIRTVTKTNYETFGYTDRAYRRSAVNNTNTNTVEFRIFKGTLNPVLFMKNIEFTHAIVTFAKTVDIDKLNTKEFSMFVGLNGGIYPNLTKFLIYKGYLDGDKEKDSVFKQK